MRTPAAILVLLFVTGAAADWPSHRHDASRSGRTDERLDAPRLVEAWVHDTQRPAPAWPGPARWDAFAGLAGLRAMRNYDPVHHVIAVGEHAYYGSSADDTVRCLEIATGDVLWRYTTDGPIRVAPHWWDGKLYFGSDDGHAYCLDALTGELLWRVAPVEAERFFLNDGRLIPFHPVRTGVAVRDGIAYFGAAMFPWKGAYLCAVDAESGEAVRDGTYLRAVGTGRTLEGALLVSGESVIVPQGRVAPILFDRADGTPRGSLAGGGGSFVLLTDDERILHGPGNKTGWITDSSSASRAAIASYERGNAIVVDGGTSYLLSDRSLGALDRATRDIRWSVKSDTPFELILAGDTLFAGGEDVVTAYDATTGTRLWTAPVRGRAYGLAISSGRLLVSTDDGAIHCFVEGPNAAPPPVDETRTVAASPDVEPIRDATLLDRWVFQGDRVSTDRREADRPVGIPTVRNEAGRRDAELLGAYEIERAGALEAVALDGTGTGIAIAPDYTLAPQPARHISIEAWARIDTPLTWGGIVTVSQDNGAYEKGWTLGYRDKRPGFALAAKEGDGRLTWITTPHDVAMGAWHHIVGTYDGETQRLYLDGALVAESTTQRGDIDYPDHAFYHAGAYRDDDEHFRMTGAIHEIRLWNRALGADEVAAHHASKAALLPSGPPAAEPTIEVVAGPTLRFIGDGQAEITWETNESVPTVIEHGRGDDTEIMRLRRRGTEHRVVLEDLRPNRLYTYRLHVEHDGELIPTPWYDCDTYFDHTHVETTGLAVLIGPQSIHEIRAIAYKFGKPHTVIALMTDRDKIDLYRRELLSEDVYGSRIALRHVDSLDDTPLPSRCANLVLAPSSAADEARRLLRPGSKGYLDTYTDIVGDPVPGAADWTHMYGSADNAAYAGETLDGASATGDVEVQWAGRPGPRYQSDRQNRKPAPLAANGVLYMQGLHRIIAADAYNGLILWAWELPKLHRFNVPRDCANWCADDDHLYIAMDGRAYALDARRGDVDRTYDVLDDGYDWGYIARADDLLLGSSVKRGASFTAWWGSEAWYDGKDGDSASKVCSDRLFALRASDGTTRWTFDDGLVVNATITVTDDRVHFVVCRSPEVLEADTRRVTADAFWNDLHLVTLDLRTGRELWQKRVQPMTGTTSFALAASDERLVMQTSARGQFALYVFDATDGRGVWWKTLPWETDHHGKHLSRTAIVEGKVILRPHVLDLETGDIVDSPFPVGHQCGSYAASSEALFLRAGDMTMWNPSSGATSRWSRVRPDCWISTIPAAGMVLSPEGGGGCSCGSWMETSMAFMPTPISAPVVLTEQTAFHRSIDVEVRPARTGRSIHYTTDGADPSERSPRLTRPLRVRDTTTVRMVSIADDDPTLRSEIVERTFTRLDVEPMTEAYVSFQPDDAVVEPWIADTGHVFGTRGAFAYGWSRSARRLMSRRDLSADDSEDTAVQFEPGLEWSVAVSNGTYAVTIGVGDQKNGGLHTVMLEGVIVADAFRTKPNEVVDRSATVKVTDGTLTLSTTAIGSRTTRVAWICFARRSP